ncbi:DUF2256 domain-containing protein [Cobetia sp. ICG0124]
MHANTGICCSPCRPWSVNWISCQATTETYKYGINNVLVLWSRPRMHRKPHLPSKLCQTCQRPFTWRKKWQDCWEDVRHCSQRCRRNARQAARETHHDQH